MDVVYVALLILATWSVLVMVHELGHCIVAKWAGVQVERFELGVGPTLLRRVDRTGMAFSLKAIPLGGFTKLLHDQRGVDTSGGWTGGTFVDAEPRWKLAITLAGSGANFVVAFVIILAIELAGIGHTVPVINTPTEDGRAFEAGLRAGDQIVAVDGKATENWQEVGIGLFERVGSTGSIELSVLRAQQRHEFSMPIKDWQSDRRFMDVFGDMGISHGPFALSAPGSVIERIGSAIEETFVLGVAVAAAGFKMIFHEMSILNFVGPLELLLIGEDGDSLSWVDYAKLLALFSIALGIINLLPGPVVDGVGVILATGELVTRRRVTPGVERLAIYAGIPLGFGPLALCIGYEIARMLD